jgi:UDP-N-acetylglucosamine 3-dehydrogenase
MSIKAAVIGCGKRGRIHAKGLSNIEGVNLVAFADPFIEAANTLAQEFENIQTFSDTPTMLSEIKPDIVAICTRPAQRLNVIQQCVDAQVKALQCEKPMALSWNDAQTIHQICEKANIQLAFTHQRRFRTDFSKAKQLLSQGAIGDITEIQGYCSNFFDWGTHWFDMWFFLLGDPQAKWVLGQADFTDALTVFDAPLESRGISRVCFDNGIQGLMLTEPRKGDATYIRVIGENGILEIFPHGPKGLRMLREGGTGHWENPPLDIPHTVQDHSLAVQKSLEHSVACLQSGQTPLHGSTHALKATELIYATFASAKRNQRIDLPLENDATLSLEHIFQNATFAQ